LSALFNKHNNNNNDDFQITLLKLCYADLAPQEEHSLLVVHRSA